MNLQGIVAVSGKPGLWRALAQNKTGYVLESLDAQKTKLIANLSTAKLAALNEITIFGLEDDIKLTDVFGRMKDAASVPAVKDDGKKLREFFYTVAADHDEEKVYSSDIKKIISWFHILKDMPLFSEEAPAAPVADEAPAAEPEKEEAPVAEAPKAKAKKAPAKKA
ncbi:DUF5606 family protein [Mucilaginibacter aquariorum]|uniref:DUF5606 domain-containing protein n=1 Tax=Mucilaginibacter aquariorum TaxID=2967225 RepID=A0ABT1T0R6_9SPHI|nr:DUF5606 domain-containing protein [Mucilaginibacter aquariorum]MCQ6958201.1 DUF5606 domain-containing protein [Mucilaginibacter aquariorum]